MIEQAYNKHQICKEDIASGCMAFILYLEDKNTSLYDLSIVIKPFSQMKRCVETSK